MTTTESRRSTRAGTVLATRPLMGWRTVDLLTVAFLGVAFGVAYWGYGLLYNGPVSALGLAFQARPIAQVVLPGVSSSGVRGRPSPASSSRPRSPRSSATSGA